MNRTAVGVIALALLIAWGGLFVWGRDSGWFERFGLALGRPGVLLAVLWLALPDLRSPRSQLMLGLVLASAVVLLLLPRAWPLVLAAFVVLAVLRPRRRHS